MPAARHARQANRTAGSMLTDIFMNRYADVPLWRAFEERDRRFLVQAFRIVEEEAYPYYVDGSISEAAKAKWETIHARLSTELGLKELGARYYSFDTTFNGRPLTRSGTWEWNTVCERFVCAAYDGSVPADAFMKARMSFFEIALRELYEELQGSDERLGRVSEPTSGHLDARKARRETALGRMNVRWLKNQNRELRERYGSAVEQFSARLRQARFPLNYHNGFVQLADDEVISSEVEQPFWDIVSDQIWRSVDEDMKEAVDRRDTGGRDAAFYAARALEGTIKIISDSKGWTHGGEKGAHGYLDNLGSARSGAFIARWERETLKTFFSEVRNPFAHAPGSSDVATLRPAQTDWAIESCMSWIKSLIQRI